MTTSPEQEHEIRAQRERKTDTARVCVTALDQRLYEVLPVLDHGFVRVVDYMGDDGAVVQAARVSYGQGTRKAREDENLIRYLMRHRHSTPFEMCEIKLHVKLPIFVARQWIRHRTANVNEYSARYSILDSEFYVPTAEDLAAQSAINAQGRGEGIEGREVDRVLEVLREGGARAYSEYEELLNERGGQKLDHCRKGIARELARIHLPLGVYTQWYWKTDLHNLLHFLELRGDTHAQHEIRVYAQAIGKIVEAWTPMVWRAFVDYRLNAETLSGPALAVLRRMLDGEEVTRENSGMSIGEWREFRKVFSE